LIDILSVVIIILLAGVAQSAVGFGYALFATPLLVLLDIPLPGIVTLVATCSMLISIIGARHLDKATPWKLGWIAAGVRLVSVVAGIYLLKRLVGLNAKHIKMVVGCILCLLVGLQFSFRPKPVERTHWGWAGLSFLSSGFLSGLTGMGGPPLVMWAMAHNWSSEKTRGFLFAVFCASIPFQLVMQAVTFGPANLWYAAAAVALLPAIYLAAAIGLPIGNRLPKETLRNIAYLILLAIGLSAAAPLLLSAFHWGRM
jgi:uncharacterized membrane protein YfcA